MRYEPSSCRNGVRELESKRPGLNRSFEEYRIHGTPGEFATAKRRAADIPTPEDPKIVEMQTQLDQMKKEREDEHAARERAEAAHVSDQFRRRILDIVTKQGVHPELIGIHARTGAPRRQRGVRPAVPRFRGARRILLARTVTLPGEGGKGGTPITLDPNEVTLSGDPAQRQAALDKLAGELYPNVVSRTTAQASK